MIFDTGLTALNEVKAMFQRKAANNIKKKRSWLGIAVKLAIIAGALYLLVLFPNARRDP